MKTLLSFSVFVLLFVPGCGRPPSGGGGRPEGDFAIPVVGAPVSVESYTQSLRLVGSFEAPDDVRVVSEVQGDVVELPAREGTDVREGDLLAKIDDRKIAARLREATSRLTLAEASLKRAESLRKTDSISDQEYDESVAEADRAAAEAALLERELEDTSVRSPMDGQLGEIEISRGQVVTAGQTLMQVVQVDPLEIRFEVPEVHLNALEPGLRVEISTDAYGNEVFEGDVTYLAPGLRASSRTLPVKATVPNPDRRLKPGMFGDVSLVLKEVSDALTVPESAVVHEGAETYVWVRDEEKRAEKRSIEVLARLPGRIVVGDGLTAGEEVVAEGWMKLREAGTRLTFTEDSQRYGLEPDPPPEENAEAEEASDGGDEETEDAEAEEASEGGDADGGDADVEDDEAGEA